MENSGYLVVTTGDLHTLGIAYDGSISELIYEGKLFKKQLSCRKFFREAVISHCKRILRNGESCLLVEEEELLTLWRSKQLLSRGKSAQSYSLGHSQSSSKNYAQSPIPDSREATRSQTLSPAIEPAFLERCQRIMTQYVKSGAEEQIREILHQFPNLTHRQLVDQLAARIPDPQEAEAFWQQVLTHPASAQSPSFEQFGTAQASQAEAPVPPSLSDRFALEQSSGVEPSEVESSRNQDSAAQPPFKRIYRGVSY